MKKTWINSTLKAELRKTVSLLLVVALLAGAIPQQAYAAQNAGVSSVQGSQKMEYEGDGYKVTAEITARWGQYANVDVTIANKSLHKLEDWQLQMPNEFQWNNIWNAQIQTTETDYVIIKGADWNKDIGLLGKASFGGTVFCENGTVCLPNTCFLTDAKSRTDQESGNSEAENGESQPGGESDAIDSTPQNISTSKLPYRVSPELEGLNYALFSETRNGISSSSYVTEVQGDIFSGGQFAYSGTRLHVSGSLNAVGRIYVSTSSTEDSLYIGSRNENATAVAMPDMTEILEKNILSAGQEKEKNITINSDSMHISNGLVAEENIEISGTTFTGEGIVYAGKNIVYNVAQVSTSPDARLLLCAKEGNITLNGSTFELNGVLYAPNGCVTINASDVTINGRIIADTICLNGSYFNLRAGEQDFDMIREWIEEDGDPEEAPEEPEKTLQAEVAVGGNAKQNRKVVIDINNTGDLEFSSELEADWEIIKVGSEGTEEEQIEEAPEDNSGVQATKGCLMVDAALSTDIHKELLFKEAGTYRIRVGLQQNGKTLDLEKEIVIEKDRAPEAGFTFGQDFFVRNENGIAEIIVKDNTLSPDGDKIAARTWEIIYDADGDGEFDEEPEIISEGNKEEVTYQTKKVGQYKVILTVSESFEDTIPQFISDECYLKDDTTDIPESACVIRILNEAPEVSFTIEKQKKADIVLTTAGMTQNQADYCNEQIEELKRELEQQNVDVKTSLVETSTLVATDSFAWKEYDHYNFQEKYGEKRIIERHITYEGDSIHMLGYTVVPYRDFLFVSDNTDNTKILEFDLERDKNNWHTIEGGGFLFNTEIDEENNLINGFSVLLGSDGVKIMQINKVPLDKFRDGNGTGIVCIESVKVDNVLEKKHFKIKADKESVTVWCNGEVIIADFVLPESTGYGYGPILWNKSHSCSQLSYFDFTNIKMTSSRGQSLYNAVNSYDWREGARRYVIHVADDEIPELSEDKLLAYTAEAVVENGIELLAVGNNKAEEELKKLINITDNGLLVSGGDLPQSMNTVREYICRDIEKQHSQTMDYYSTEDLFTYRVNYQDKENDPIYRSEWSYEVSSLSSQDESAQDTITEIYEVPKEQIKETGAYMVSLRVQDNPDSVSMNGMVSENNISGNWSESYVYPSPILIQTLPETKIETKISKDSNNKKNCAIKVSTSASDKDHMNEEDRGIIAESLMYKEVNDNDWTEGSPISSLPIGGIYLFKYQVQDKEKSFSYPNVLVVDTNDIKEFEPYEDTTKPEISLSVSKKEISLGDSIRVIAYAQDENPISTFSVSAANTLLGNEQGIYTYTPQSTGNIKVRVYTKDVAGNASSEDIYIKVVDKDINPPHIQVDGVSQQAENPDKLIISGTIDDDKTLEKYTISYRKNQEEYTEIYSSAEEIKESEIARIDIRNWADGEYELLITAVDQAGNSGCYSTYVTITRTTIEGEKRIWLDDVVLNREEARIEIYGTLVQKDETETVSANCVRVEDNVSVSMNRIEVEDGLLAVIPTEDLPTGHYEVSFMVVAENGDFSKETMSFTYTCKSQENEEGGNTTDDVIVVPGQEPVNPDENPANPGQESPSSEKSTLELELSRTEAEIDKEIIARINTTGTISENSIKVMADGIEVPLVNGKGSITSHTPKQVNVSAEAYTGSGQYLSVSQNCCFVDKKDKTPPKVSFKGGDEDGNLYMNIKQPTDLIGSVSDEEKLLSYRLTYRMEDWDEEVLLAEGTEEKQEEVLGTLDTTILMNGAYEVRLTAMDAGGNESTAVCNCVVEGNLKVGEMAIGFTDLTTQLPFGNININRMYDSRSLTSGDFGYGWSLGLAGMTIRVVKPLEKGYEQVHGGSGLSTVFKLQEKYPHQVVVSYGDGTSDRFSLKLSPASRRWLAIEEVSVGFVCDTNPNLHLELAEDNSALVDGDRLEWLEGASDRPDYIFTMEDGTKVYISEDVGVTKTIQADGTVMTYSPKGFLTEDGKGVVFERDRQGRITRLSDDYGHTRTYQYDEEGNLSTYTNQAGESVTYTYDDHHRLAQIIDPSGIAVARYEYDQNGKLIASIDAEGNRQVYDHDTDNYREIITDRRGYKTVYEYDKNGNVTAVTDPEGNTTRSTFDEKDNLLTETDALGNTKSYAYDENNNITQVTDAAGNISYNYYDSKNQVTSMKNMDGTEVLLDYNEKGLLTSTRDTDGNRTSYTYDDFGNVSGIADELGQVVTYTYDKNGNVTQSLDGEGNETRHTYDAQGNRTSTTQVKTTATGNVKVTTKYTYDDAGRITKVQYPDGGYATTTYDESGNISATRDEKGQTTTYTYTPGGEMDTITYYDGTTEHFTYDEEGNVLTRTDRLGNTVSNTYDKAGNLKTATDELGNVTSYEYDAAYRVTKVTAPTGAETSYTYDSLGRNTVIRTGEGTITYTYDAYSNVTSMTDAKGNKTTYEYDNLGNRTAVCLPDGSRVETIYDSRGNILSQKDGEGNTTTYTYDNNDNLTTVTSAEGETTSYVYNGAGELLTQTDAAGNVTTYTYNTSGELTKETRPDGKYRQYAYRTSGEVTSIYDYDRTGQTYTYNSEVQLTRTQKGNHKTYYTYNEKDQLETVYDTQGTIRYGYDTYGRVTSRTTATGEEIQYTYDTYGRISEMTTGEGSTVYTYDKYDRLTSVTDAKGNVTSYTYDVNGNKNSQKNPDGTILTFSYDSCNRLQTEEITDKEGELLARYSYTYNGSGQKTSAEETVKTPGGETVTISTAYSYDKANRLTGEESRITGTGGETAAGADSETTGTVTETRKTAYTYDEVGNRVKKLENGVVTEYTYNQLNQLTEETTEGVTLSYAYDVNGNLLCRGTDTEYDTYTYTGENQLASVTSHKAGSETTETYTYDAEGNRLSKTTTKSTVTTGTDTTGTDTDSTSEIVSEEVTYYVMDTITGYSQVIAELDENRETKVLYTRGDGLVSREEIIGTNTNGTGEADSSNPGTEEESTIHFYLSDGHGDVRQLTDENGKVTDSYRYNSFGELEERAGVTDNPYLYTGEYYDEGTGLYYLRARYMNPETGTFISMDSYLGNSYDPASLHRYTYAQNNPQMYNDPSGHFATLGDSMTGMSIRGVLRSNATLLLNSVVDGIVNSILNQVLETGENPLKSFVIGFVTGLAGGAAYRLATALVAVTVVDKVVKIMGLVGASTSAVMSVSLAIQERASGNNKNAAIYLTLGVFSAVAFFKLLNIKGIIKAIGPKGTATFESGTVSTTIADPVDLTDFRKTHILNNHKSGAGKPDKTEFPKDWSDEKILHYVSDVATDPNATWGMGKWNSPYAVGVREGIEIRVDFYPDGHPKYSGKISTAYPLNTPPNPPKGGGN